MDSPHARARTLVIGSKNTSSWSLRPWLLMRQFGITFEEIVLPLDTPEFHRRIGVYSPTARVPSLLAGDETIYDSLAICETVNERWLDGRAWPVYPPARAAAQRRGGDAFGICRHAQTVADGLQPAARGAALGWRC